MPVMNDYETAAAIRSLPDAWEKRTGNIERGFCYDRNIPICKGGKGSAVIEKKLELEQYIEIVFSYNTGTVLNRLCSCMFYTVISFARAILY